MAAIRRDEEDLALFTTPVENLFLLEYLASAPGDFVKVYLYGLWAATHPGQEAELSDIAKGAGVEEDVALSAFLYWERMKLVRVESRDPLEVAYRSAFRRLTENRETQRQLYRYAALHQRLQNLFGSARLLTPYELDQIDRWAEEDGLSEEAVCAVCEYALLRWGAKVTPAELKDAEALWRQKGAVTPEAARALFLSEKALYEAAKKILRSFSLRREPTQEELRICREAADAGLEPEAMLIAAAQAGTARNPGFNYLRPILQNLIHEGYFTAAQVKAYFSGEKKIGEDTSRLLRALGFTGTAPAALGDLYRKWLSYGFSPAALEKLCRLLASRGQGTPEELTRALERLAGQSINTDEALEETLRESDEAYALARKILGWWGESREPGSREAAVAKRWMKDGHGEELLRTAAELAAGAQKPLAYMQKVLDTWKAAGVTDPDQARAMRPASAAPSGRDQGSVHFALEKENQGLGYDVFVDLFEGE